MQEVINGGGENGILQILRKRTGRWKMRLPEVSGVYGRKQEGLEITDSTIVYLENDIDMGARQENGVLTAGIAWDPIGVDKAGKFTGTFEGNNHKIKGIYVKKDGNFAGLFGNSDTIQNLTIADSYIVL